MSMSGGDLADGSLLLEIARLQSTPSAVQQAIDGIATVYFGLGSDLPANITLRKRLGVVGPPFGGGGFIDPQHNLDQAGDAAPPAHVTAEIVRTAKLKEFERCADGAPSMYFWALQPIFDTRDRAVSAETLLRARNGSDCAPFEDIKCLNDPTASDAVRRVYAAWKAAEIVDFALGTLKDYPVLQNLRAISVNIGTSDLGADTPVYVRIAQKFRDLPAADRELLREKLVVEITEDQAFPEDFGPILENWQRCFGFRLAFDDAIGELARKALRLESSNFHVTTALRPVLDYFCVVKVDMEWAGYIVFLSHPSYSRRAAVKAEVLQRARDEDLVYVPQGPGLRSTGAAYSALLAEFAAWACEMMLAGKTICVELSVDPEDESAAFALGKLRGLGVDMFGAHKAAFCFQGGRTGAKAFEPAVLAGAVVAVDPKNGV